MRHEDRVRPAYLPPIDDLLTVWGFDIPLKNAGAFQRLLADLSAAAADLNRNLIGVSTNLRDKRLQWNRTDWPAVAHGCALAAVGLVLEDRFGRVLIGASRRYADLSPNGSHPLTDPLLSTHETAIVHDGAAYSRIEKIKHFVIEAVVQKHLRVCWKTKTESNCSRCHKCYRTMATLDLLGVLDKYEKFDGASYDPRRFARLYTDVPIYRSRLLDLRTMPFVLGRNDVVRQIDKGLSYSRLRQFVESRPALHRGASWIRSWIG